MRILASFFFNVSALNKPLRDNQSQNEYERWFHFIQLFKHYSGKYLIRGLDRCALKQHTMNIFSGGAPLVRVHVLLCGYFCTRPTIMP